MKYSNVVLSAETLCAIRTPVINCAQTTDSPTKTLYIYPTTNTDDDAFTGIMYVKTPSRYLYPPDEAE